MVVEGNFLGPRCQVLKIFGWIAFLSKCNLLTHFPLSVDSSLVQNESFQNCSFSSGDFADVYSSAKKRPQQTKEQQETPTTDTLPVKDVNGVQLYSCPREGCVKTFQRYYNLEQHLFYGKCEMTIERYSLLDTAKRMYNEHLRLNYRTSQHTRPYCVFIHTGRPGRGMGTEINKVNSSLQCQPEDLS